MIEIRLDDIYTYNEAMREYDERYSNKYQLVGYRINYIAKFSELILAKKDEEKTEEQ